MWGEKHNYSEFNTFNQTFSIQHCFCLNQSEAGSYRREYIIEKQSPVQVSHYLLKVRPPDHDWSISLNQENNLFAYKGRGKKALYCIRQNYAAIDILWYYFYCSQHYIVENIFDDFVSWIVYARSIKWFLCIDKDR